MIYREIEPFTDVVELTSFVATIEMIATYGRMARSIIVVDTTAGTTLEIVTGSGQTRSLTVADNDEIGPLFIHSITDTTTVTRLRVFF